VAYSSGGNGSILFIEVADMPGSGSVQLTGKLGDVLKESVEVALSWVKAHAYELGLTHDPTENIMKKRSIHVHCPSGAIPKVRPLLRKLPVTNFKQDGPSAGMAHTIALISLFSGKAVPPTMAMTVYIPVPGVWSFSDRIRVKFLSVAVSQPSGVLRRSSSERSELVSRLCSYRHRTGKSKYQRSLRSFGLSLT